MIQLIKHRCNNHENLLTCDASYGVEIDLRSDIKNKNDLHLAHDPFQKGESFRDWLVTFKEKQIRGPVILNTKEDGLEKLALDIIESFQLANEFIFLDTTLPTLKRWTRDHHRHNFFIRWSSIEPIEFAKTHAGFCDWAWIDCFERVCPPYATVKSLSTQFKTCLVSPELQGGSATEIQAFASLLSTGLSAVCTKFPEKWEEWM